MTPSSFFGSGAALAEKEEFTKPGTANVTPADSHKLKGIKRHYALMPHGFTQCVKDQVKHGLSKDHANRRCAVIMDLAKGTTKWRGKAKEEAVEILAECLELLHEAGSAYGGQGLLKLIEEDTEVFMANSLVEGAPRWMLPIAARKANFKPTNPEKNSDFEKKHPRGKGTTGGQFVRKGSSGVEVNAVQQRLNITRTGTYGGNTTKRVEQFQKQHGLTVDGVVGAQTVAAMRGQKAAPGALSKNDRRYLRRYARRT